MSKITSNRMCRTVISRLAITFSCGVLGFKPITAEVVGWWGFEGCCGEQASIGTVFENRFDPSILPAEVYARYEGAASLDYQPVFTLSDNGLFIGDATTSVVSGASLKFMSANTDEGVSQGCPVRVSAASGRLDLQTFSLEGWFKCGSPSGSQMLFSRCYGPDGAGGYDNSFALYVRESNTSGYALFFVDFCARTKDGSIVSIKGRQVGSNFPLFDGKWHYVSLVINGEKQMAHLFFDFSGGAPYWRGQVALGGELVYNDDEPLVIGGHNRVDGQFCGEVDEVRLSDTIINTEDSALKVRPGSFEFEQGMSIGFFEFEGNYRSTDLKNFWPAAEVSAATGGVEPVFVDHENRTRVCDGNGAKVSRRSNTKCLHLNKSKISWPDTRIQKACTDSMTVEFFVKANASENSDWAGIARAECGTASTLAWNVSHHKSNVGDITLRFDAPGYGSYLIDLDASLDGKWHHIAITMANVKDGDENKLSYSAWVDYQCKASGLLSGWTYYSQINRVGFGLASTPFVGDIDEFRITRGILPVDKFMRLAPCGGMKILIK